MQIRSIPENEKERRGAVRQMEALDNIRESDFDEMIEIALQLSDCPICMVTIIKDNRQLLLAKKGFLKEETQGVVAFCQNTINSGKRVVLPDVTKDARFKENPVVVGPENIRFYAGTPLITKDGLCLGTLCVMDRRPRRFSKKQLRGLQLLSTHTVHLVELWQSKYEHDTKGRVADKEILDKDLSDQIINSLPGIFYLTSSTPNLIRWNKALEKVTGYSSNKLRTIDPLILFDEGSRPIVAKQMQNTFATGYGSVECIIQTKTGEKLDYYFTGVRIEYEGAPAVLGVGIDITESKKRNQELSDNREFLRSLVQNLPGYFYRVKNDKDYTPVFISEGVTKVTGYEVSEYLVTRTITCGQEIIPEQKDEVWDIVQTAISNKEPYQSTYQIRTKEGKLKWLWERGNGVWDSDGNLLLLEGFVTDISDQKKTELQLAAKEDRLKTILTTEPECIKMLNKKGELLEMNPAGLAMIEADSEDQVRGMQVVELVSPSYQKKFAELTKRVFKGESGKLEFELIGIKGTSRWLSTHAVPFRNVEGEITSLLAVTADITERKKVEESLINAEQRYRHIFENASEGIYQSTPSGEFITVNNSFAKIFGYGSPSELIANLSNIDTQLFVDPKDRLRLLRLFSSQDSVTGFEMKAKKKNGEIIWVKDNMHAVRDEDGTIVYLEGTLEDITESVHANEKLRIQFNELQKTNFELDHFVYSVSHDLRAPLTSIMGLIDISELENPPATLRNYLRLIKESAVRLDGFIHDILNYSRNSRIPLKPQPIDFKELIKRALENVQQIKGMERLHVSTKVNGDVPLHSDQLRLEIIFGNILSNAIKYQDRSKEQSTLVIDINIDQLRASIVFHDNGIGIETTQLKKVFEMFFRASTLSIGSGLGLYIAKESIEKLEGTISIDSKLSEYTTIQILIPQLK